MSSFVGANLTRTYTATQLANDGSAPGVGDVYHSPKGKRYRFVKFDNGAGNVAAVTGKAAYYFGTGASSSGETALVTMDLTDSVGAYAVVAGIFQSVPGDGEYCWIQTWGVCTLATTLVSGADGAPLGSVVTGGTDGTLSHADGNASGAAAYTQNGVIIDASAKVVFLRLA